MPQVHFTREDGELQKVERPDNPLPVDVGKVSLDGPIVVNGQVLQAILEQLQANGRALKVIAAHLQHETGLCLDPGEDL